MIEFVPAKKDDLPKIVEIYNQIIPSRLATADLETVTVQSRKAWFDSFTPTHPIWIIKKENKIVGWVALEPFYGRPAYEHTAEISIYIDKDGRHQGLGKKAVEFVINQLPHLGITAIVAYIFSHNLPSQKLFKSMNFTQWGHLPNVALMDGKKYSLDILGRRFD